jgi:hypothetical protein
MSTKTKISEMPVLSELTSDIIVPASQKSGQTYISGTISLEALKNYLKPELENHINNTNQHVSDEERNAWNRAVTTLEAFLKDADTSENAVDTLVELQRLMDGDGFDATELLNRIAALESIDYATKADIPEMPNLDGYATTGEVGALKSVQDMLLDLCVTWSKNETEPDSIKGKIKTAIDALNEIIAANYALKSEIPVVPSLDDYATTNYVNEAISGIEIPEVPNLDDYATTDYVDEAIAGIELPEVPSLDGYAKLEDLNNISAPDLSNYALKSDIPSTAGFASINSNNNLVKDSSTVTQLTIGSGLQSPNNNCLTVGRYNSSASTWNAMLWIGSGTSTTSRKNQMIVQENQLHYRGELKEASGWIGDFGEYFEWNDGNPNNEDRIGYMVQLNEDKIELAESFENCIGVISDTCIITGGGCSFEWHNMYLRDDFGRELKDENGNSIVNPEYNPDVEYISRDKRQEWGKVGILGQVHTRQDGTLKVGGFAGCENGIATDSDHGYRVLRIINENVAVLLVK